MSTTVQQIIDYGVALSVANQGLATNTPDLIRRINQYQRARWTAFTQENRYYYQTTATVTSTAANGNRVADCSGLTLLVERMLIVKLASGTEVREVDLQNINAELAPRYYPSGQTLIEVGTDWDITTANPVTLTVSYCWRPADLDPLGATTQLVSVPDGYVSCLGDELGAYFALSDFGRSTQDPTEVPALMASADDTAAKWLTSAGHFAGRSAYTWKHVTPTSADKK